MDRRTPNSRQCLPIAPPRLPLGTRPTFGREIQCTSLCITRIQIRPTLDAICFLRSLDAAALEEKEAGAATHLDIRAVVPSVSVSIQITIQKEYYASRRIKSYTRSIVLRRQYSNVLFVRNSTTGFPSASRTRDPLNVPSIRKDSLRWWNSVALLCLNTDR